MRSAALIGTASFSHRTCAGADRRPRPDAEPNLSSSEVRELLDAAKATAKATRENVDYVRVVPDILFRSSTKLDKLEDKLDKIETEMKRRQEAIASRGPMRPVSCPGTPARITLTRAGRSCLPKRAPSGTQIAPGSVGDTSCSIGQRDAARPVGPNLLAIGKREAAAWISRDNGSVR